MTDGKTFWLSFAGEEGFRGATVIDVPYAAAQAAIPRLPPTALPDAEWLLAAVQLAYAYGCNPGGQVAAYEVGPDHPAPRHTLLTQDELYRFGKLTGDTHDHTTH